MIPLDPAVFAIGAFVLFCYVLVIALCMAAAQADEDMERRRQIEREFRDIERGIWPHEQRAHHTD